MKHIKPEFIIALLPYLTKSDSDEVEKRLRDNTSTEDLLHFVYRRLSPIKKAVVLNRLSKQYPELEEILSDEVLYLKEEQYRPSVKPEMEYVEYLHRLPPEEQEYVRQFYNEYYNKGSYGIKPENRIMKTPKMIEEANRTNNSLFQDALTHSQNRGIDIALDEEITPDYQADQEDWEAVFNRSGYLPALECITDIAVNELENSLIDKKIVLMRYSIRFDKLRRLNNHDMGRGSRNPKRDKKKVKAKK